MSVVGEMVDRKDRPAYVRFERRPDEDRNRTVAEGRYVARDVDYALITPPYSRDVIIHKVPIWLQKIKKEVERGRLPQAWYERYVESYERWRKGEEMPLDGTPIKGWAVISPAQQTNLIAINVRTVEDLAAVNDEGMRRIGMGSAALRDKARAWLSQAKDKGPLTMENAALKSQVQTLTAQNESLERRVQELAERVEIMQRGGGLGIGSHDLDRREHGAGIEASDIIEEVEKPKRGRPRKAEAAPPI